MAGTYDDRLTERLQEDIIILLAFDDNKATLLSNMVDLSLFEGIYRDIAGRAYDFIGRYQKAPKEEIATLFDDILEGDDRNKARRYGDMLSSLYDAKEHVNAEYVMDRISTFVRQQEMKAGVLEAAEILHEGGEDASDRAEAVLNSHMRKRLDLFDPGTFLDGSDRMFKFMLRQEDSLPLGIKELDHLHLGPAPDTLHMLIGVYNTGKTWHLVNAGRHALMVGKRVCHVSLEMPEDQIVKRYLQAWFAISKEERKSLIARLDKDQDGNLVGIDERSLKIKHSFIDPDIKDYIKKGLARFNNRLAKQLVVKNFPTSTLTVGQLKAYLDNLEDQRGFVPDLLLIDYIDLMHFEGEDSSSHRISLGRTVQQIRGIAGERHIAVASVSQSNREGGRAKVVRGTNVAEDWSKMATADTVLTYNQTEQEMKRGLARIGVDKARDARKGSVVVIVQSYETGQFCLDSAMMPREYYDYMGIE